MSRIDSAFVKQLEGFSLVTARIFYRMPDYRSILQEFLWQEYDLMPRLPELEKFLDFWDRELEGPIYSVEVASNHLITPREVKLLKHELTLIH